MILPLKRLCFLAIAALSYRAEAQDSRQLREQVRAIMRETEGGTDPRPAAGAAPSIEAATRARMAFQTAEAERLYRALLSAPEAAVRAHARLGIAATYAQSARYGDAVAWFDTSARAFATLRDSAGEAESWLGQSQALLRTRGIAAGRLALDKARTLAPPGDAWLRGNIACTTLFIRIRGADSLDAAELRRSRQLGRMASARAEATCILAEVELYEGRGQATLALAMLDTLAQLQTRARLTNSLSATRQWQGWILVTQGDYVRARAALDEAVRLGVAGGTLTSAGWANSALAEIARRVGSWTDGARYARRAEQAFTAAHDGAGLASARIQSANVALSTGDLDRAAKMFAEHQGEVLALFPRTAPEVLAARSDIARHAGDFARANILLDSAALFVRRLDLPGYASDLDYRRALMALDAGTLADARRMLSSLLARPSLTAPLLRYQTLSRLAEVEARDGRTADARRLLERAHGELDRWRAQLQDRALRLAAAQTRGFDWDPDLGVATVIAALATRGEGEAALSLADARRARVLLDEAVRRDMLVGDTARTARDTGATTARRRVVREGTAVLSYVTGVGGEPTTIFVVTSAGTSAKVTVPVDSITDVIRRFVAFVDAGHLARPAARRLAEVLIDPILPLLAPSIKRLVIVPDGSLHRLPFATLLLPNDSLLAQRFEIVTAPSAEIAMHGLTRAAAAGVRRGGVLAFGAPAGSTSQSDGWPALPGARDEMQRISGMVAETEVVAGASATLASLRAAATRGGPVLHFATHARAMEHSLMSGALLFAPEGAAAREATAPDLAAMTLPFDLVVLSACESGNGALYSGEGLHGIATAFLEAGARAVLATRWRLEDRGSEQFLDAFYESLVRGRDAAAALSDARRQSIDAGHSPAVWANFELIGDPWVAPELTATPLWRRGWPVVAGLLCLGGAIYGVRVFTTRMML